MYKKVLLFVFIFPLYWSMSGSISSYYEFARKMEQSLLLEAERDKAEDIIHRELGKMGNANDRVIKYQEAKKDILVNAKSDVNKLSNFIMNALLPLTGMIQSNEDFLKERYSAYNKNCLNQNPHLTTQDCENLTEYYRNIVNELTK